MLVLSVPVSVVQTIVAKKVAILRARGDEDEIDHLAASGVRSWTIYGLMACLILVAGSPFIAMFLRTGSPAASLLGPYVLLAFVSSVPLGVLQGRLQFTALAWAALLSVVVRLVIGIGLVWAGFGIAGAIMGTVLGQAATLGVALLLTGIRREAFARGEWKIASLRGDYASALLGLGAFWLLAEIDLVLARHYLSGRATGLYSSAGVVARALLFLPGAVSLVALPRFSETEGEGPAAARWLKLSMGAVAALLVVALPVLILVRRQVIDLAFGARFESAGDLVPILALGMALLALTNVLVYFHIAAATYAYRLMFGAAVVEALLIALFHRDPKEIAWIVTIVAAAITFAQYLAARSVTRWSPSLAPLADMPDGDRLLRLSSEPTVDLSIVLPCRDVGEELPGVLAKLLESIDAGRSYEVVVVSDGSIDQTVDIAERFASRNVRVVPLASRSGKGMALRIGLAQARGRYVAFMDADGDIDPSTIGPFLTLMDVYEPDIILGSKRHPMSEVSYPPLRRLMSFTYHKLARVLFRVRVRDTQTGMKLIRRDVLAAVLPRMLEKRYAFDLELLVVARSLGFSRVFEAPVTIDYRFSSNVGVKSLVQILLDTGAIFYRLYVLGTYSRPAMERKEIRDADVGGEARLPTAVDAEAGLEDQRSASVRSSA